MKKKIEIQVPEGKVAEEKDNRPVTERIKTLEDATTMGGTNASDGQQPAIAPEVVPSLEAPAAIPLIEVPADSIK